MRVLVTGGAGFIGSAVVDALAGQGIDVVVLDALLPAAHQGMPGYLNPDASYRWANCCDPAAVAEAVQNIDVVSHQAAMVGMGVDFADTPAYARNNDLGTAVLLAGLAAARFAGRLVLASSMVVYGEGRYRCPVDGLVQPLPRTPERLRERAFEPQCPRCGGDVEPEPVPESAALDPRSVYAATKAHQEQLCACFARETGCALTVLRYHNVYGPRMPARTQYAGVAAIFRSALASGQPARVFEDGGQRRDFVHVDDVARANLLAAQDRSAGWHVCNVASGRPVSILEMARALAAANGAGTPAPVVTGEFRLGDVRHVFASTHEAETVLGFRAAVGPEEGMRRFATAELR
ncbi:MAG TPA: NAD-dependent epimerase/dehydratase family protein [Acidimicrobiia bacterium]|nr:NAD-dependent epimerase/dehydratase family protein [Acidimicrobiia bacterium]